MNTIFTVAGSQTGYEVQGTGPEACANIREMIIKENRILEVRSYKLARIKLAGFKLPGEGQPIIPHEIKGLN